MPTKDKHRKRSDRTYQSESTGPGGTPTGAQYTPYAYAGGYYPQQPATPALNTPAPSALTTRATSAPYTRTLDPPNYATNTLTPGYARQPANPVQSATRTTTTEAPSYGVSHPGYTGYSHHPSLPYRTAVPAALPPSRPTGPYANVSYSTGTGTGTGTGAGTGTTPGFPTYTSPVTNPSSAAWPTAPAGQVAYTGVLRGGGAIHSTTKHSTGSHPPTYSGYGTAPVPNDQQGTSTHTGTAAAAGSVATGSTSTPGAGANTSGVTPASVPNTLAGNIVDTSNHDAIAAHHKVSDKVPKFFVSSFEVVERLKDHIHPAFSTWVKDPKSANNTSVMWHIDEKNRILPMAITYCTTGEAKHHGRTVHYKHITRFHLNKDHKTFAYEQLGTLTEERPYDPGHLHLTKKVPFYNQSGGKHRQVLGGADGMFRRPGGNTMYPSNSDPNTKLHTDGIAGNMLKANWEVQNDKSLLITTSGATSQKSVGIITYDKSADLHVIQAPIVFTHSVRKDPNHSQYPKNERDELIAFVFLALMVMPVDRPASLTKFLWWIRQITGASMKGGSAYEA